MSLMCTLDPMAFLSTLFLFKLCNLEFLDYIYHSVELFYFYRKIKKGSLLIDSSTIDPAVSKEMASAAEKLGAVFMDAPVSGGKFYTFSP